MFRQQYRDGHIHTDAQQMVRALHEMGLSDDTIALLAASTQGTINKIRHGHESGRNLAPRLARLCETINAIYERRG